MHVHRALQANWGVWQNAVGAAAPAAYSKRLQTTSAMASAEPEDEQYDNAPTTLESLVQYEDPVRANLIR